MSFDSQNKIVRQSDGRLIYANGFGGISTVEPLRDNGISVDDLAEARRAIQKMDTKAHGWVR